MIKGARDNMGNDVCKEMKMYFVVRKGMRYGDSFLLREMKAIFVLQLIISKQKRDQGTD